MAPRDSRPRATPAGSERSAEPTSATRVVVIGDSDTGGAGAAAAWPSLVEQRVPDTEVDAVTTGDSGYVSTTAGESTLADLVSGADLAEADLVVLFGSRFDASGISDQVSAAAEAAIAGVRGRAPGAAVLVIGPVWPDGAPPAGVRNNRDVVRAAADAAGATFVDPLSEGWLAEGTGLVDADDVHLTDRGQVVLADLIGPVIAAELEGAPTSTGG